MAGSSLWGVELVLARCWACEGDELFEPVDNGLGDAELMCGRCGDAVLLGVLAPLAPLASPAPLAPLASPAPLASLASAGLAPHPSQPSQPAKSA